ncbi:alpha/beta fold hydrolase [Sinomonas atrocyanea]
MLGHGVMLDSSTFERQLTDLSPETRIIAWDSRAHGRTTYDGKPFTEWDNARDLIALLDALDIDRAVLGGHSQGGFVAICAALLAPERVAGLILIDTTPHGQEGATLGGLQALGDAWAKDGPTPELCATLGPMVMGDADLAPWIAKWKAQKRDDFTNAFRAVLERDDLSGRIQELIAPTLVVHGSEDSGISVQEAREWSSLLPNGRPLVVIEGAPHLPTATHPDEVTAAIRGFLAGASL